MKKSIYLFVITMLMLVNGCANMFSDVAADQFIQQGKIYVGMPKSEFPLSPPPFGVKTITTSRGTEEVWDYGAELESNYTKIYKFYFDANGKLAGWETR